MADTWPGTNFTSFIIIDLYSMTEFESEKLLGVLDSMGITYQMVADPSDYEPDA